MAKKVSHLKENPKGRDHEGPVKAELLRLRGLTRKDIESDANRGSLSPLGAGSYSVRKGRRK